MPAQAIIPVVWDKMDNSSIVCSYPPMLVIYGYLDDILVFACYTVLAFLILRYYHLRHGLVCFIGAVTIALGHLLDSTAFAIEAFERNRASGFVLEALYFPCIAIGSILVASSIFFAVRSLYRPVKKRHAIGFPLVSISIVLGISLSLFLLEYFIPEISVRGWVKGDRPDTAHSSLFAIDLDHYTNTNNNINLVRFDLTSNGNKDISVASDSDLRTVYERPLTTNTVLLDPLLPIPYNDDSSTVYVNTRTLSNHDTSTHVQRQDSEASIVIEMYSVLLWKTPLLFASIVARILIIYVACSQGIKFVTNRLVFFLMVVLYVIGFMLDVFCEIVAVSTLLIPQDMFIWLGDCNAAHWMLNTLLVIGVLAFLIPTAVLLMLVRQESIEFNAYQGLTERMLGNDSSDGVLGMAYPSVSAHYYRSEQGLFYTNSVATRNRNLPSEFYNTGYEDDISAQELHREAIMRAQRSSINE